MVSIQNRVATALCLFLLSANIVSVDALRVQGGSKDAQEAKKQRLAAQEAAAKKKAAEKEALEAKKKKAAQKKAAEVTPEAAAGNAVMRAVSEAKEATEIAEAKYESSEKQGALHLRYLDTTYNAIANHPEHKDWTQEKIYAELTKKVVREVFTTHPDNRDQSQTKFHQHLMYMSWNGTARPEGCLMEKWQVTQDGTQTMFFFKKGNETLHLSLNDGEIDGSHSHLKGVQSSSDGTRYFTNDKSDPLLLKASTGFFFNLAVAPEAYWQTKARDQMKDAFRGIQDLLERAHRQYLRAQLEVETSKMKLQALQQWQEALSQCTNKVAERGLLAFQKAPECLGRYRYPCGLAGLTCTAKTITEAPKFDGDDDEGSTTAPGSARSSSLESWESFTNALEGVESS